MKGALLGRKGAAIQHSLLFLQETWVAYERKAKLVREGLERKKIKELEVKEG
jgi:hypothetical protein